MRPAEDEEEEGAKREVRGVPGRDDSSDEKPMAARANAKWRREAERGAKEKVDEIPGERKRSTAGRSCG